MTTIIGLCGSLLRGSFNRMLLRAAVEAAPSGTSIERTTTIRPDGWVYVYARLALGAAFLSAVASRFGLWDRTLDLKHFANFLEYTAEVNSFMPPATIPLLAWAATVAETSLGILLISGWWSRWVSLASAVLLAMFGTAMAISFGLKSPMDYSVFSASAAAALLAQRAFRQHRQQSSQIECEDHDDDEAPNRISSISVS